MVTVLGADTLQYTQENAIIFALNRDIILENYGGKYSFIFTELFMITSAFYAYLTIQISIQHHFSSI